MMKTFFWYISLFPFTFLMQNIIIIYTSQCEYVIWFLMYPPLVCIFFPSYSLSHYHYNSWFECLSRALCYVIIVHILEKHLIELERSIQTLLTTHIHIVEATSTNLHSQRKHEQIILMPISSLDNLIYHRIILILQLDINVYHEHYLYQ